MIKKLHYHFHAETKYHDCHHHYELIIELRDQAETKNTINAIIIV